MKSHPGWLVLLLAGALAMPARADDPVPDREAEAALALRLFGEREAARRIYAPPVFPYLYPVPGGYSAEDLARRNQADFQWLWIRAAPGVPPPFWPWPWPPGPPVPYPYPPHP